MRLLYDYFIKDHLGNVRMVLTDEVRKDIYPIASLENASAVDLEDEYYNINQSNIVPRSSALAIPEYVNKNLVVDTRNPHIDEAANSGSLYRLNGTNDNTKMGLGITLKVMAGDEVQILGKSYWKTAGMGIPSGGPGVISVLNLLKDFVGSSLPGGGKAGVTGEQLNLLPDITGGLGSLLSNQQETSQKPKAYINWILFDENLRPVISVTHNNSSFDQVDAEGILKSHFRSTGEIMKSGYLYIYCSNESKMDVFFDNLQVVHTRGPLLEETHYYPFGLTLSGISTKAAGGVENKKKYQQYELNSDFDINLYESFYRSHDPQLGRFWQIDPKPTDWESPYAAMGNNPILNLDRLGDTTYRFDKSTGAYIGMFDLDAAGHVGSYGAMKTIGKGKNKQEVGSGTGFEFADPQNDAQQIRDGIINQLVFVSNDQVKSMLTAQGAFNPDNSYLWEFFQASGGGGSFDYSFTSIPQTFPGASTDPLNTPSPMLFLVEGDRMAHNHMNFGNYLWAASGYTLGFGYGQLQSAAHLNSRIDPGRANGYDGQWDSSDDQRSIIQGANHAERYKYRNILKARNPNKGGAPWSGL